MAVGDDAARQSGDDRALRSVWSASRDNAKQRRRMVIFASRGLTLGLFANNVGCHLWFHVSVDHGDDAASQVLYPAQLLNG